MEVNKIVFVSWKLNDIEAITCTKKVEELWLSVKILTVRKSISNVEYVKKNGSHKQYNHKVCTLFYEEVSI